MPNARRITEDVHVSVPVRPTPFGLYCAVALAAGIVAGLLLIDYVTRPGTIESPDAAYEVMSGSPVER